MPVDVQNREDQLLGAAWRRCEAACRDADGYLQNVQRCGSDAQPHWHAFMGVAGHPDASSERDTPAAALDALTEALANR